MLLLLHPAQDLPPESWARIHLDFQNVLRGLFFVVNLPDTFRDPDLVAQCVRGDTH
jgi:hypothetical protein